jgi:asparagine synthase (glutamine-hydrolysing)
MCGIVAIWSKTGKPVNRDLLSSMQLRLKHRGPDAEGLWMQENLGFAHSRLKIIDLSDNANQPFMDGNDVLIFNGEIFNYKELRSELAPYRFKTTSDTEVLFRAVQEWDVAALEKISGQFAFVFYSKGRSTLLVARDHVGICPLYTYEADDYLYIASEIKPLLEVKKFAIDPQGVFDYFAYRYNIQNGLTLFEGIRRFAPGHYWQIDLKNNTIKKNRYWRLEFRETAYRPEELQDRFEELLDSEISLQSTADVPVGIYLSGGIDSKALLCGYSKAVDRIDSFTVSFASDDPDVKLVNILEQKMSFNKNVLPFTPDIFDHIEDVVLAMEEPFADLIICANYLLAQQASELVKVVLSGEGGDEVFMGYDHQRAFLKMRKMGEKGIAYSLMNLVLRLCPTSLLSLANPYPGGFGTEEHRRIREVFGKISGPVDAYIRLVSLFDAEALRSLFSDDAVDMAPRGPDTEPIREIFEHDKYVWQAVMRSEIEQLTLIVNLLKQDRFGMRFSLEGRVPLVSLQVIDFAASLPVNRLLSKVNKEFLIRYSSSRPLKKRPFSVFASPVYRQILMDLMNRYADRRSVAECGLLSWDAIAAISSAARRGQMLAIKKAMAVVIFMIWWKVFRVYLKR